MIYGKENNGGYTESEEEEESCRRRYWQWRWSSFRIKDRQCAGPRHVTLTIVFHVV